MLSAVKATYYVKFVATLPFEIFNAFWLLAVASGLIFIVLPCNIRLIPADFGSFSLHCAVQSFHSSVFTVKVSQQMSYLTDVISSVCRITWRLYAPSCVVLLWVPWLCTVICVQTYVFEGWSVSFQKHIAKYFCFTDLLYRLNSNDWIVTHEMSNRNWYSSRC